VAKNDSQHLEEEVQDSELNVWIRNEDSNILLRGVVDNGDPTSRKLILLQQPDGTLRSWSVSVGIDPDDNERITYTDSSGIARVRPYEPYRTHAVVALGAAWAAVYTCPADTIDVVTVRFGQTSVGTVDYEAALRVNGLTIAIGIPVYTDAPSPVFGPYHMAAAETIDAYRYAGGLGAVSLNIERYSTGDENVGV